MRRVRGDLFVVARSPGPCGGERGRKPRKVKKRNTCDHRAAGMPPLYRLRVLRVPVPPFGDTSVRVRLRAGGTKKPKTRVRHRFVLRFADVRNGTGRSIERARGYPTPGTGRTCGERRVSSKSVHEPRRHRRPSHAESVWKKVVFCKKKKKITTRLGINADVPTPSSSTLPWPTFDSVPRVTSSIHAHFAAERKIVLCPRRVCVCTSDVPFNGPSRIALRHC